MKTEPITTIFENEVIKVTTRLSEINDSKSIYVHVNALNPVDGKMYKKHAGWLSKTMALHGTANTREYALETASIEIKKNNDIIRAKLIDFGRKMENIVKAGTNCNFKESHPQTEKERFIVKKEMQNNTNHYTNHM